MTLRRTKGMAARASMITMVGALASAMGCASSLPGKDTASGSKTRATEPARDEAGEAQQAWCQYLEALYLRADATATVWPRYAQCMTIRTTASPKLLRSTAECSHKALDSFKGDPFTPEYAAAVSQCGSDALDAASATNLEMQPYVETICGRMQSCSDVDVSTCQESLQKGIGDHLGRAIGAINDKSKDELRACFKTITCDAIGNQISACIEPLMNGLLWLPG